MLLQETACSYNILYWMFLLMIIISFFLCTKKYFLSKGLNFYSRIDEDLHVKICDTALSRDFFPGDYHCLGDNENRPVRWLASECLETNTYLYASDVVSVFLEPKYD